MEAKRPKTLFIISSYYPDIGGMERMCQGLARELSRLGHEVAVLTHYREGRPGYDVIDGIPVYRYIKGWHLFELTYMLSVLSFLIRHRRRFTSVVCFGLYLFTAPAVLFCRCTGRRVFVRLSSARHTGDFHLVSQLRQGRFIGWCGRQAHGAVAISREIEGELLGHGFDGRKIFRIPSGVDTERFSPGAARNSACCTVCYVGRLTAGKGLELLLEAAASMAAAGKPLHLVLAGGGELLPALRRQAAHTGLEQAVTFTGPVDDVVPVYRQADIFVLPSLSEGLPLSLLEAMACGLAVVASRVGGVPDVLDPDGRGRSVGGGAVLCDCGMLVEPGSAEALAAALQTLIADDALRGRLGAQARALMEKNYSARHAALQYQKLVSTGRSQRGDLP